MPSIHRATTEARRFLDEERQQQTFRQSKPKSNKTATDRKPQREQV